MPPFSSSEQAEKQVASINIDIKDYLEQEEIDYSNVTTTISAKKPMDENATFITPGLNRKDEWYFKDNKYGRRTWQPNEFFINNVIYVDSINGTEFASGTKEQPVNTLKNAYKIANSRDLEIDGEELYYIVLKTDLELNESVTDLELNESIIEPTLDSNKAYNYFYSSESSYDNLVSVSVTENNDIITTITFDLINLEKDFDVIRDIIPNKMILVLNKRDVLPKSVKEEKLVEYFNNYNIFFDEGIRYKKVTSNGTYKYR